MIGPCTDLQPITYWERIRDALPASAMELSALLEKSPYETNALLCGFARRGKIRRTGRTIPNGNTGRGPQKSPLWEQAL